MKHIIKIFTVTMPPKMARSVKKEFDAERKKVDEPLFMLALRPIAASGECRVAIISKQFGVKLQKTINAHKS